MKKYLHALAAVFALSAVPMAAQAVVVQFNAALTGANEVPGPGGSGDGIATLFYDTTADTYDFALSAFGLNGTPIGYHLHASATTTESSPVVVNLAAAPFFSAVSTTSLLVGGNDVAAPSVPLTPVSPTNAGHPPMTFLQTLQGSLVYVNIHTTTNPQGTIRGQLLQVAAVPEPSTYALLLAGIGVVGMATRRRQVPVA